MALQFGDKKSSDSLLSDESGDWCGDSAPSHSPINMHVQVVTSSHNKIVPFIPQIAFSFPQIFHHLCVVALLPQHLQ